MPKPVPRTLLHSGRQIVDRVSEPVKKLAFVAKPVASEAPLLAPSAPATAFGPWRVASRRAAVGLPWPAIALRAFFGQVESQGSAAELIAIELPDGLFRVFGVLELYESEAAGAARVPV